MYHTGLILRNELRPILNNVDHRNGFFLSGVISIYTSDARKFHSAIFQNYFSYKYLHVGLDEGRLRE
jgi:hypothetical protein